MTKVYKILHVIAKSNKHIFTTTLQTFGKVIKLKVLVSSVANKCGIDCPLSYNMYFCRQKISFPEAEVKHHVIHEKVMFILTIFHSRKCMYLVEKLANTLCIQRCWKTVNSKNTIVLPFIAKPQSEVCAAYIE